MFFPWNLGYPWLGARLPAFQLTEFKERRDPRHVAEDKKKPDPPKGAGLSHAWYSLEVGSLSPAYGAAGTSGTPKSPPLCTIWATAPGLSA